MKLAAKVKLATTPEQSGALLDTLKRTNQICNWISAEAWKAHAFQQFAVQKLVYHPAKEKSGLTSQILIRAISKVADTYKLDKKVQRSFRPAGSIAYDDRILRWHVEQGFVSIWSTAGRLRNSLRWRVNMPNAAASISGSTRKAVAFTRRFRGRGGTSAV